MGSSGGGMIFYGSKGMLMADVYGQNPRFIPESYGKKIGPPKKSVERAEGIHEEWVAACKGNGTTSSNFGYAAALTETMLLGNVAIQFSDQNLRLKWDAENMKVKQLEDANTWLDERNDFRRGYREIIGLAETEEISKKLKRDLSAMEVAFYS
ncbi:MAG: hypothetical protein U5K69_27205 [Balneolaceae bacterium]|nr:hypothetical protein [Balneolaceae bacterium]